MSSRATRQDVGDLWLRGQRTELSSEDGRRQAGNQLPAWNSSTTVVQTIRDALIDLGVSAWSEPQRYQGPALDLETRPLDLGIGLWR